MSSIFVSYLRRDLDSVKRLVQDLTAQGADIWWDQDRLAIGDRWRHDIGLAIGACDYFILCFSSAFRLDGMSTMEEEMRIAVDLWDRKKDGDRKWILPIKIDDCAIPQILLGDGFSLSDLHWIRLDEDDWKSSVRMIADIVLQRARERMRQDLRRTAEAYETMQRQQAEARAFAVACSFNESSKTELARIEALLSERRDGYMTMLDAYRTKHKDDYNPRSGTDKSFDHIVEKALVDHWKMQKAWLAFCICFLLFCFLVAFLIHLAI